MLDDIESNGSMKGWEFSPTIGLQLAASGSAP